MELHGVRAQSKVIVNSRPAPIEKLYAFLAKNHRHNRDLQERSLGRVLASCPSNRERALVLLHSAVNSQSQPKLTKVSAFFKELNERPSALSSLANFRRYLLRRHPESEFLFDALSEEEGWGPKTAALFLRNLVLIASHEQLRSEFWADLEQIGKEPTILPVDAVILEVFRVLQVNYDGQLDTDRSLNSLQAINDYLRSELQYDNAQMLIWDDLWFWGFITQWSSPGTKSRTHAWNEDKYWSILSARKSVGAIRRVQGLSGDFLNLLANSAR